MRDERKHRENELLLISCAVLHQRARFGGAYDISGNDRQDGQSDCRTFPSMACHPVWLARSRSDSDFDLLIVAPSDKPRWRRTALVYRLLAGLGAPKDIIWWTPEEIAEWQGVKAHFINIVLREGKVLYERPA